MATGLSNMKPNKSFFKSSIKILLLLCLIIGIIWHVTAKWDYQVLQDLSFNWYLLMLSCGFLALSFMGLALIAYKLLSSPEKIKFRDYSPIYFLSQLGRYIPGKIWLIVGKVELLKKKGFDRPWTTFVTFLEMALMLVGAGIIVLIGLVNLQLHYLQYLGFWIYLSFLPVVLFLIYIPNFYSVFQKIITRFSPGGFDKTPYPYRKFEMQIIVFYYALVWLLMGSGFTLLVKSVFPGDYSYLYLSTVFTVSWIIGFISLLSPSGIGVRESIMILLLSEIMPITEASIIAIISRIWFTGIELLLSCLIIFPTQIKNFQIQRKIT